MKNYLVVWLYFAILWKRKINTVGSVPSQSSHNPSGLNFDTNNAHDGDILHSQKSWSHSLSLRRSGMWNNLNWKKIWNPTSNGDLIFVDTLRWSIAFSFTDDKIISKQNGAIGEKVGRTKSYIILIYFCVGLWSWLQFNNHKVIFSCLDAWFLGNINSW